MHRRLFTLLSVLSLVLCVGTAWAWYSTTRLTIDDPTMPSPGIYILTPYPWLGWLSIGLFVTAMVMLIIRIDYPHLLGGRTNPGHCATCGYDLRATSGRCPECGTEPKKPPTDAGRA
jgi:hypothetical protein